MPVLVSGKGTAALRAQARRWGKFAAAGTAALMDVGFSAAVGRACFEDRAVAVASDCRELADALAALAAGAAPGARMLAGRPVSGRTAFLFSGQGSQRPGMGTGLAQAFPVFGQALDEACAVLEGTLGAPLREILSAAEGSELAGLLESTQYTQPRCSR